jgi:hypothetical protein
VDNLSDGQHMLFASQGLLLLLPPLPLLFPFIDLFFGYNRCGTSNAKPFGKMFLEGFFEVFWGIVPPPPLIVL